MQKDEEHSYIQMAKMPRNQCKKQSHPSQWPQARNEIYWNISTHGCQSPLQ